MKMPQEAELNALYRSDFYTFLERSFYELNPETGYFPNWHIEVVAQELEKCRRGETTRLIINVPPRSLKSHCASVAFPAWLLGHNPAEQIITVSYGQDLADKHALDCRTVMLSRWYQRAFATRLASSRPAVSDFRTTLNGFRLSVSVGGAAIGRGGEFIIIDDPLKPDEALSETQRKAVNNWYDHTLITRLNNKKTGRIIVIMQRLHEDDLVGHLLELGDWKLLRFPAIAEQNEDYEIVSPIAGRRRIVRLAGEALHPEREPLHILEEIRHTQGEYNFAGQYQQAPAPLGGGLVKSDWFKTYCSIESPRNFQLIAQSWDTANKPSELSDFSVCTTWGLVGPNIYLLNVYRKRVDYPDLKRAVREQADMFGPRVILIEDKASGTQLLQELVREGIHAAQSYKPTMDKVMRLRSVCSTIENGFVYLPEKAPWLQEFLHEITTFPNGKHDDQTDSTSQALDWAKTRYLGHTFQIYNAFTGQIIG
jgi:predicted phage terminase large subunit-like protein